TFSETAGTTTVNAGGTLAATTIDVAGGALDFTSAIAAGSGAGNFDIGGAGIVVFGGAVDAGHSITFTSGAGVLALGAPGQFAPTIDGFSKGDTIDLLHTAVTSLSFANNVLTIMNGSTNVATLDITGNYTTSDFTLASDNNGGTDLGVTSQSGTPSITAPAAATVGVGQPGAIAGVSIAESPTISGETFTATLADTHGLLSATGTGVSGSGTTSLTITGSLAQVDSDLATLTDTDATTPSDTIALNASDSNGGKATAATIAVTVNGLPVIAAPASATVAQNQASAISGNQPLRERQH